MTVEIIVDVCLSSFGYWWMVPLLAATTKQFLEDFNTPYTSSSLRRAHAIRQAAIKFRLMRDYARLKCVIVKHIWTLWPNSDLSDSMARVVQRYTTANLPAVDNKIAKALDMHQQYWSFTLHLLVRLAIWMDAPLRNTPLHTAFMARMDMLFKELHKVSTRKRKLLFSDFIELIRSKPIEWNSWLLTADARVLSTATFIEMQSIWLLGRRGVHLSHLNRLHTVLQGAILLLALFFKAMRCRTPASKHKLKALCAEYFFVKQATSGPS